MTWLAAAFFLVIALAYVGSCWMGPVPHTPRSSPTSAAPSADPKVEQLLADAQRAGLIARVDENLSYVYVEPLLWQQLNIDQKRGLSWACAQHFKAQGQTGYAHIYDYRSGKRLARMSSAGTFAVD